VKEGKREREKESKKKSGGTKETENGLEGVSVGGDLTNQIALGKAWGGTPPIGAKPLLGCAVHS